jgi:hypothetical protein
MQSSKGAVATEPARPQSDVTGAIVSSETHEAFVGEASQDENEPQPVACVPSVSTSGEEDGHGSDVKPEAASASIRPSTEARSAAMSAASPRLAPPTIPVVSR